MFTGVTTKVNLSRDSDNTTSKYNPTIKLIGTIKMHEDRPSSSKLIIT